MKKLLKSSTSLTLCMALAAPGLLPSFAVAQNADVGVCADVKDQENFPCAIDDGTVLETKEDLVEYLLAQGATEAGEAMPDVEVEPKIQEEAMVPVPPEAENRSEEEVEAANEAVEEAAQVAEETAEPEAEQQQEAEEQAQEEEAVEGTEADTNATDSAVENAEISESVDAAPEPVAEEQPEEVAPAEPAEAQEIAEEPQAEAVEPEAEVEATTRPEAKPEAAVENLAEAEPAAEAEPQPLDAEALAAQQEARSDEREAELEAARKALEEEPAEEMTTEEITTEGTRRSDEDFETTASGVSDAPKKKDGLSNLEKALLLGLGAAVVGTVLKNGDKVLSNSGDRIVVQDENGGLRVLKDDDTLLRRPGDEVRTERFNDGSTRQTIQKVDGSMVTTIRSANGTVLRRISTDGQGNQTILFDDLADEQRVVVRDLPKAVAQSSTAQNSSEENLRAALVAEQNANLGRVFSLRQVREIGEVRALAPQIELDAVRFASGSAAIAPEQARSLSRVGDTMRNLITDNPRTVFLIEGHTDAVGNATYNLALSDRRAETVALALTEYFDVPPANMITQGYGEASLKVQTTQAEQANRRAVVRNITNLLRQAAK